MNDNPARDRRRDGDDAEHELAAAYALDAVDDVERARFEAHLKTCAACPVEVASLRETGAAMTALSQTAPPPSLRRGVLEGISGTAQEPRLASGDVGCTGSADLRAGDELAHRRTERSRRSYLGWLAGAAAAALLVVGGVTWHPWSPDQQAKPLTAVEQVTGAKDAQRLVKSVDGARVTLVRSASEGRAVIVAKGMPPAPRGHVYEAWYFDRSGRPIRAGLMPKSDKSEVTLLLKGDADTAHGAGVTLEPAGGSDQPTTKPIVTFDLT